MDRESERSEEQVGRGGANLQACGSFVLFKTNDERTSSEHKHDPCQTTFTWQGQRKIRMIEIRVLGEATHVISAHHSSVRVCLL